MDKNGKLIISLDFELFWGVRDKLNLDNYKENILGSRKVIPKILHLFDKYEIHATWAAVGFLFFNNYEELVASLPDKIPQYKNIEYSPYEFIKSIDDKFEKDYIFAPKLIEKIIKTENQEIGSHSFSHYYCLEEGQDRYSFKSDINSAKKAAEKFKIDIRSYVFPRNQINNEYLPTCFETGIECYRGNETSWIYKERSDTRESIFRRGLRLLDSYINISGHNCYHLKKITGEILNIPASRFLRPYSNKLRIFERLKIKRILSDITYAAKNGQVYHLWWHPHNFGQNSDKNLENLEIILKHFRKMKNQNEMQSINMGEAASEIK